MGMSGFCRAPEADPERGAGKAREWMRRWWPAAASSDGVNSRRFIARHRDRNRADAEWLARPRAPACELAHIFDVLFSRAASSG
jgi:hypothetical protein